MNYEIKNILSKLPKSKSTNLSKSHKVALGLIDNFSYGDVDSLQDEVSRLSYSVDEWFDEKYDAMREIFSDLRDVYLQNSEAFITSADVAQDEQVLQEIKTKAEELGLSAEDVYPQWQEHKEILSYLDDLEKRFDEQVRKMEDFGR
jgi:hypothetical protein|tara:strand:- start:262 stop:699 length:438 start_codon:yes stop_codon:yes gene_type:complete